MGLEEATMGLFDKFKESFKNRGTLAYFAQQQNAEFHEGTCGVCGESFQWLEHGIKYPYPLSKLRNKPEPWVLNIGGWCLSCGKLLCPKEADFVPFTHEGDDWWVAGCRRCQQPLAGKREYEEDNR